LDLFSLLGNGFLIFFQVHILCTHLHVPIVILVCLQSCVLGMERLDNEGEHIFYVIPRSLYNLPSRIPMILASYIFKSLDHTRNFPSTKATISPFSSKQEIDTRLFFKQGTYKTLLIWIELPNPIMIVYCPILLIVQDFLSPSSTLLGVSFSFIV
jgi:hypothetical protein